MNTKHLGTTHNSTITVLAFMAGSVDRPNHEIKRLYILHGGRYFVL